jgi:hypothetical protein
LFASRRRTCARRLSPDGMVRALHATRYDCASEGGAGGIFTSLARLTPARDGPAGEVRDGVLRAGPVRTAVWAREEVLAGHRPHHGASLGV